MSRTTLAGRCYPDPELKVVLTSGSSDMPLAVSEVARKIKALAKPYTREQLASTLREALDG